MKLIIAIFTLAFIPIKCNSMVSNLKATEKQKDTISITYEVISRGLFEEISISKDSLTICNDINRKEFKSFSSSNEKWNELLKLLSEIDVNKLPELKAPTSMRLYDGAPHATLIISNGNKNIRSSPFDHGHPPKEIKDMVEKLLTYKKVITKQ